MQVFLFCDGFEEGEDCGVHSDFLALPKFKRRRVGAAVEGFW
jgi:hypothetical protein